jgi:serine-type D-Ala-D-Ala carboxypeptidase (penicillin-binding protein 5/6)
VKIVVVGLVMVIAAGVGHHVLAASPSATAALPSSVWPAEGQAAVQIGESPVRAGPNQHAAPIASVAKVMTAYLVLRDHPLPLGEDGPAITLTDDDVADTGLRRGHHESVVPIAAGERLTERQALLALLLPSANNIAVVLARWDAGSVDRFVVRMNATARSLGMTRTRYTDPSGYDDATVSTAADQVRIVDRAMGVRTFARIVATPSAWLPVAGIVHNTDTLLGYDGFVGVKTGSDDAAGGCFAFRAVRRIHGKRTTLTGVVLGQPGHDQIAAGLEAAQAMVDRIAGRPLRHLRPPRALALEVHEQHQGHHDERLEREPAHAEPGTVDPRQSRQRRVLDGSDLAAERAFALGVGGTEPEAVIGTERVAVEARPWPWEHTAGRAAHGSSGAAHVAPPRRQFHRLQPVPITSSCHTT